ncbi:MAG: NADH-quinone oxidoreductase subunit D [Deltaproteobacteria bacterium]|nr:NADH-quinone oxidoreductase subunit D [Deltaproteobacteria bacterium]
MNINITSQELERKISSGLTDQSFWLNMGPQHPATHGVLRVLLHLDGERVIDAEPVIGYIHRGHERMGETRQYAQFYPNTSRMDYIGGLTYNHGYCAAVEKLANIEVPARAEYIRVISNELNRIGSHLLWLGAYLMDLGAFTPFLYIWDDREAINDILNRITGSRLTYSYNRFGGVHMDIDDEFIAGCREFIIRMRKRLKTYDRLVTGNIIFKKRAVDVGLISAEQARQFGLSGPCLRASGVEYDIRKKEPYSIYSEFDFDIPIGRQGDTYDRYLVRIAEMEQSLRIIEQALGKVPDGAYINDSVPRDLAPEPGEVYFTFESPRGEVGIFIVSDGTRIPLRMHWKTPSYSNLSIMATTVHGVLVADVVAIMGSLDLVIPEIDR